jgi:hypothetical protein
LARYLSQNTLSSKTRSDLLSSVASRRRNYDAVLKEMIAFGTSPQNNQTIVTEKLNRQRLNVEDLIPDDMRFWDNLTAPLAGARSLSEFMANEMKQELDSRLGLSPTQAIWARSLTFCAPGTVPIEYFRTLSAEVVFEMMQHALTLCDHFTLIGSFEICADWVKRDKRFAPVGDAILAKLFDDKTRLEDLCKLFGAAFMASTARHALSHEWKGRPTFWRRIASAAHASLFARTAGLCDVDATSIHEWARQHFARAYVATISMDLRDEPRWRPEWIKSSFLLADVGGRARHAIASVDDKDRPASWAERQKEIEAWLSETKLIGLSTFPAVGESAPAEKPQLDKLGDFAEACREFVADPAKEKFLAFVSLTFSWGLPAEVLPPLYQLLINLRDRHADIEDKEFQLLLTMASHVSILARDSALAERVADLCVERIRGSIDTEAALDCIFRVIECCFGNSNLEGGKVALVQRMETFAFSMGPKLLFELLAVLRLLQGLDKNLEGPLARAVAAARLGLGAVAA